MLYTGDGKECPDKNGTIKEINIPVDLSFNAYVYLQQTVPQWPGKKLRRYDIYLVSGDVQLKDAIAFPVAIDPLLKERVTMASQRTILE